MSSTDLSNYYRRIKKYVGLPSGTDYYTDVVINFTESGEVGIRSMTSDDEIILKNPDALLNGEAVKTVLLSCVDGLKDPTSLLTNDVDLLLSVIREVSYGESVFSATCAKCETEMSFALDIERVVSETDKLESDYVITTTGGLDVYVRPFTYSDKVMMMRVAFEQEKIKSQLLGMDSPEQTLKVMSKSISEMTTLNAKLICNSIYRLTDDKTDMDLLIDSGNKKEVLGLIKNIDLVDISAIEDKVKEINDIGINKKVEIVCTECENKWSSEFETNPVNFSLGS